jgi:tetratricopeptide (TPR) repeat protein
MRHLKRLAAVILICGLAVLVFAQLSQTDRARLQQLRNLGKAFYENPTTQKEAAEQFRQALALAPGSSREQLNYALALLRAGDTESGITQLEKAQKLDPSLPHTWFNLGIAYQKQGDLDRACAQFQKFVGLVPKEPVAHYHLGTLNKLKGDAAAAVKEFETARDLNPLLAAPHFQLYGIYRQQNRPAEYEAEMRTFQGLKKQQAGAAVPEDMDWCAYAEIYDPIDFAPASPVPAPVYREEKVVEGFAGVTALTLDGGPRASLIAWSRERVVVLLNGTKPMTDSGLEDLRDVLFIAPGDFDNDGLPDLCVVTATSALLYRNVGGKFRKHADLAAGNFRKAVWMDFDHDYDQDLFLIGNQARLLRNNGAAGFSDETGRFPFVAGHALDAVPFDLEPDTPGFDLVVSYEDRRGVLYRDDLGGSYHAVDIEPLPAGAIELKAYDYNGDSRTDLVAAHGLLLLNKGGSFQRASVPAPDIPLTADFAGNGRLDRVRVASDSALMIGHEISETYGNWIGIALMGVKNPKLPVNTKVEVKAGMRYEKATYTGVPLVFRLGDRTAVETVRITWPNGLIQNEINPPVNRLVSFKEAQRLSGSCPMIFTWNGTRFQFITDVLGVAPLGASSGDGEFFPVDHDEYVTIPAEKMVPRDGRYEIRVTEELREVSYLDQIKLIALDHPADIGFVTDEKFKSPPFPEFRLYGVGRKIYPAASDGNGTDVSSALRKQDRVYPSAYERDASGVAELHYLDLDFGSAAAANRAVLVLHGWVDWADGSTFLASTQAHRNLVFPYLQVKDAAGNWKTVIEDMGIPSGKPKTMAVDLTGKFPAASRQVRIVTNLCVYWDEIFMVEDNSPPPARLRQLPLSAADLHFRGFSKAMIDPRRQQPEQFDYQSVSATSMWNPTPGNYTRYGTVTDLLAEIDDRMVVMGSGDEVTLLFDPHDLPLLPARWRRDFLLFVDGWAKDGDANTAFSQSVMPLPFHSMSRYPYRATEIYPRDAAHLRYLREYITRPALRLIRSLAE